MVTPEITRSTSPLFRSSKDSAPGRVDDLDLQVLVLGNGVDDVDIKTDDLLVFVLKRKRGVVALEATVSSRAQHLGVSTQRKTKRSDQAKAQGKKMRRDCCMGEIEPYFANEARSITSGLPGHFQI